MRAIVAVVAVATLSGCAAFPGCYVGVSLLPPSPIVVCGVDFTPPEGED